MPDAIIGFRRDKKGDAMEHPIKDDFFLEFKAIYNINNEFTDYILINTSSGFKSLSGKEADKLLGISICDLIIGEGGFIPGGRNLYYHMIPNTKRKLEIYFEPTNSWYMVDIFSDKKDKLLVFYSNITRLKENMKNTDLKANEKVSNDEKTMYFHKDSCP